MNFGDCKNCVAGAQKIAENANFRINSKSEVKISRPNNNFFFLLSLQFRQFIIWFAIKEKQQRRKIVISRRFINCRKCAYVFFFSFTFDTNRNECHIFENTYTQLVPSRWLRLTPFAHLTIPCLKLVAKEHQMK